MTVEEQYRARYKSGDSPWDIGRPDFNLIEVVTRTPIRSCKVLEIGCGTGDNSIWLAQNRFEVVGIDASEIALEKAREIFDRGCFHSFGAAQDRQRFAQQVARHLEDAGLWLTLAGNADEPRQEPGPPQRTAGEIVLAVEPYFEVLSLTSSHFGSNRPHPPRAWRCLLQKRHVL